MKLYVIAFNLLLMIFFATSAAYGEVRCIVIDPGHGGKDPGAVAGKLQEKTIALQVAIKLGNLIEKEYPGIKLVYTRKDDRFIELSERSNIANKAGADLFISIHTNAIKNTSAYGTETFVMGVDKSNANLSVAMRENSVITFEDDYSSKYEGYDPTSSESYIIFTLMQSGYLTQSLKLAAQVQNQYCNTDNRRDRGVKQAGFLVLWRTAMPSILTEIGFISNPDEAKYISSEAGQKAIAASLFRAVKGYIEEENSINSAPVMAKEKPNDDRKEPVTTPNNQKPAITSNQESVTTSNPEPKETQQPEKEKDAKRIDKDNICYRMQLKSSSKQIPVTYENFSAFVTAVQEVKTGDTYKYYCGRVKSYKDALILQRKVRQTFSDAFCVAFDGDEQIAMDKAKKLKP